MMTASKAIFYAGCMVTSLLPLLIGRNVTLDSADRGVPIQWLTGKWSTASVTGPTIGPWNGYPIVGQGVPHFFGKHGLLSYGTVHANLQRAYIPETGLQIIDQMHFGQPLRRPTSASTFKPGANKRGSRPAGEGGA